jgi:hypothetical protein
VGVISAAATTTTIRTAQRRPLASWEETHHPGGSRGEQEDGIEEGHSEGQEEAEDEGVVVGQPQVVADVGEDSEQEFETG